MPPEKGSSPEPIDSGAREKFYRAVCALATGPGDVRSRLETAYLALMATPPAVLPKCLRTEYEWVLKKLTEREKVFPWEGRLQATLRSMQNRTGVKIAEKIVLIELQLRIIDEEYRQCFETQKDREAAPEG